MRLGIDARARGALGRLPVITAYSALELALLAGLAVQTARLLWTIATPVGPLGAFRATTPGISGSPIEMLKGFDPFFRLDGGAAPGPAVVTALQLTLFGTRVEEASGRGSAIIAGADGEQKSYSVGAEVSPGVVLKAVAFDHVTLSRGGGDEDLFINQSGGSASAEAVPPASAQSAAPGSVLDAAPSAPRDQPITLAQLKAEIGFIPRIDGGRVTGLVVRPQGSGAAFRRVGLKEGDIVTQIGGRPVSGQGDIDGLAAQFGRGGNISLSIERGAEVLPLVITVAPQ